jgi:hypothetical protein
MKAWADKMSSQTSGGHGESEVSSGMLYSTGLVAGGSLTGVAIALLSGISTTGAEGREISILQWTLDKIGIHGWESLGGVADVIGIAFFAGLCFLLIRAARQKLEA